MSNPEVERFILRLAQRPTSQVRDLALLREEMETLGANAGVPDGVALSVEDIAGCKTWRFAVGLNGPLVVYFHGGGYVAGSPGSHRHLCGQLALAIGGVVLAPDYRLAPEHPFPAALEDAVALFEAIQRSHPGRTIALAGDSAGGGLAFACAQRLLSQGSHPGCIVGLSPWLSHVMVSPSFDQADTCDPCLSRSSLEWYSSLYRAVAARENPGLSPLLAVHRDFPPMLVQVGAREVLRDDAINFAATLRGLGNVGECQIWPDMIHAWHLFWPWLKEGREAVDVAARFIAAHCTAG